MNVTYKKIGIVIACMLMLNTFVCFAEENIIENSINIYVSSDGYETGDGSFDNPFSSVENAKAYIRTINSNMNSDINVYLRGGTYRLADTLVFDENDSGSNGYYINYLPYNNESVSIIGSREIKNWTKHDNLWVADYNETEFVRTMYVGGKRAKRAESEEAYIVESIYNDSATEYEADGIVVAGQNFKDYTNKENIQLHFGLSWVSALLNVTDIIEHPTDADKSVILMKQPEFQNRVNHGLPVKERVRFYIENAFEELDTQGEFYFDRLNKKLYYMPFDGQEIENASAEIPYLDKLMSVEGNGSQSRVKNISFNSLNFSYCKYDRPAERGLEILQATQIYNKYDDEETDLTPAAITLNWAEKIKFENNVIRGMESVGISLLQGVKLSKINANVFEDLSDSAITVGNPSHSFDTAPSEYENLASGKQTKASGNPANYPPSNTVDENAGTGWSGEGTTPMWWQVDLGDGYEIDLVEIEPRPGYDNMSVIRSNFQILGSNTEDFSEFSVLATQGAVPFEAGKTAKYHIKDKEKYRYIRVQKADASYLWLSEVRVFNDNMPFVSKKETCSNNMISNNYITAIGIDNWSAPGICAYYVNNLTITHNTITNIPYSGISVGWGWNSNLLSTVCRDNVISFNRIDDYNKRTCDGGGIYTLGQQPNSVITGNYISNQHNHLAGLYSDNGTKHYKIFDNVCENTGLATYVNSGGGDLIHRNNYTTDIFNPSTADSIYEEPTYFIPGNPSLEVLEIIKNAGIEEKYSDIVKKSQTEITQSTDHIYSNVVGLTESPIPTFTINSFPMRYILSRLNAADKFVALATIGEGLCQYPGEAIDKFNTVIADTRAVLQDKNLTANGVVEAILKYNEGLKEFEASHNTMPDNELIKFAEQVLDSYEIGYEQGNVSQEKYDEFKIVINEYKNKSLPLKKIDKLILERLIEKYQNDVIKLDIKEFKLENQLAPAIIDNEKNEIYLTLKYGSRLNGIMPYLCVNSDINIYPAKDAKLDFSKPVQYTLSTRSGSTKEKYNVHVKYPELIDSNNNYNLKDIIADEDNWAITGTIENNYYKNLLFGNTTVEFDMNVEKMDGQWGGIAFRSQDFAKSFEDKDHACYVIVFTETAVELHRFNNGVRTQFYGNVKNVEQKKGPSIETDVFKMGQDNHIKLTAVNKDDGVEIVLEVNGEEVFNVLDNYDGAIMQPGYFGTVTSRPKITLR